MTEQEATFVCEMLVGNLKFFPAKPAAQALIVRELIGMCSTLEQGMWLAQRMCQVFTEWQGLLEMRAVFCSKYKPKDGIEKHSEIYLDGIPSEKPPRAALPPGKPVLALPEGHAASVDPEAEKHITELVQARAMPPVKRFRTITEDEARVDALLRGMHGLREGE